LQRQKPGAKINRRRRRKWEVKEVIVRFVPFESEAQTDEAYRLWVRSIETPAKVVASSLKRW